MTPLSRKWQLSQMSTRWWPILTLWEKSPWPQFWSPKLPSKIRSSAQSRECHMTSTSHPTILAIFHSTMWSWSTIWLMAWASQRWMWTRRTILLRCRCTSSSLSTPKSKKWMTPKSGPASSTTGPNRSCPFITAKIIRIFSSLTRKLILKKEKRKALCWRRMKRILQVVVACTWEARNRSDERDFMGFLGAVGVNKTSYLS